MLSSSSQLSGFPQFPNSSQLQNSLQPPSSQVDWISRYYIEELKPISEIKIPTASRIVESRQPDLFDNILKGILFKASLEIFHSNHSYGFTGYDPEVAHPHIVVVENENNNKIFGFDNYYIPSGVSYAEPIRGKQFIPVARFPLPNKLLGEDKLKVELKNSNFPKPADFLREFWGRDKSKKAELLTHLTDRALANMASNHTLWGQSKSGMQLLHELVTK